MTNSNSPASEDTANNRRIWLSEWDARRARQRKHLGETTLVQKIYTYSRVAIALGYMIAVFCTIMCGYFPKSNWPLMVLVVGLCMIVVSLVLAGINHYIIDPLCERKVKKEEMPDEYKAVESTI